MSETKNNENCQPVFRLKPTPYSNSCIIKHVGYLNENEKLGDEIVEFKTSKELQSTYGKNVDYIGLIMGYNIKVYIFKNNIIGSYLLKNDYIPIYSISIAYEKNIVTGPLFDIYLGFKLDETSKEILKTPTKITNAHVTGSYQLKIYCDELVINNINNFYNRIGKELIRESYVLAKLNELSEEEFTKYLEREINTIKSNVQNLIDGINIDIFKKHTHTIENILRPLYNNNKLNFFIKFCLEKREAERRQTYKAIDNYELPKRVLNIKDVENNENYLNEYLGLN
jgi:hypothetical protein